MQRCLRCQGSKKIAPMGGIYVTCIECNGIGFVESQPIKVTCEHIVTEPILMESEKVIIDEIKINDEPIEQLIIKKRGRPKGWTKQQGAM